MQIRNVVLVDGARSAFARGGRGKLTATRLDEVAAQVIRALLARNPKVKPSMIEDIGLGNVFGNSEFSYIGNVQRLAGLPLEACAFNVNRQCGSSMEAIHRIALGIMVGHIDCGLAIGIERMGRGLNLGVANPNRITKMTEKINELTKEQLAPDPNHDKYFSVPFPEYIRKSPWLQNMVQTAQNVTEVYDCKREDLDRFAVDSHAKGAAAYEKGFYKSEVIPLEVELPVFDDEKNWLVDEIGEKVTFDRDECIRESKYEKLASLNPIPGVASFGDKELMITPGNACPTNDGVSTALIMSEEKAIELGLEPIARITSFAVGGVKPQLMGLGPVVSSKIALERAGLTADQIDRVEFNEAFSAQVLPSVQEIGLAIDKVNLNGGSLGVGHPLGATGARLVTTVGMELRNSGTRYGLATQCIGAGMGITTILERMD